MNKYPEYDDRAKISIWHGSKIPASPIIDKSAILYIAAKDRDAFFDGSAYALLSNSNSEASKYYNEVFEEKKEFHVIAISSVFLTASVSVSIPLTIQKFDVGSSDNNTRRSVYVVDQEKLKEYCGNEVLRVGYTVHSNLGGWSSYPTHEFESREMLSPGSIYFQEKFMYFMNPIYGWAIQLIHAKGAKKTEIKLMQDGYVSDIPLSFHPVVAAPNTLVSYVWAYVGGEDKFNKHGRV